MEITLTKDDLFKLNQQSMNNPSEVLTLKIRELVVSGNKNDPVTMKSPIFNVSRVSRNAAIQFVSGKVISEVVPIIYTLAVKYSLDPAFCIAEAINETGWGTSYDARVKHNWFGYDAIAKAPNHASSYASNEEAIDKALADISKEYCSVGGAYYDNGTGRTIAGWASHWINDGKSWVEGGDTIIALMNEMMRLDQRAVTIQL